MFNSRAYFTTLSATRKTTLWNENNFMVRSSIFHTYQWKRTLTTRDVKGRIICPIPHPMSLS